MIEMTKEQLIALGLTEEQADKVVAGFGSMIPKTRFDEINEAKKQLETQIKDRDKQLDELKKIDAKGLQAKIDELQSANETTKKDYEAKLKETQLSGAVKLALAGKVHDADLVASLIDSKTIELDKDGNVTKGLDEQLKTLQESKSFLFVPEKETKTNLKGTKPAENPNGGEGSVNIGAEFAKMQNDRGTAPNNDNNPWG
jgi:hypothetical protein